MGGAGPLDGEMALRRLASVKHAAVAHLADAAQPRVARRLRDLCEGLRVRLGVPRREQDEIAQREDRVEDVPGDQPRTGVMSMLAASGRPEA